MTELCMSHPPDKAIDAEIASHRERLALITLERQQHETDKGESVKARTQVELVIRDLQDNAARNEIQRTNLQADLSALEAKILSKEGELHVVEPEYQDTLRQEANTKNALEQAEAKQGTLFAKQSRTTQFHSQSERDAYLRNESNKSSVYLQKRESTLEDVKGSAEMTTTILENKRQQEEEIKANLEKRKENIASFNVNLDEIRKRKAGLQERRKESWKEDSKLDQTVRHAREELGKAQRTLYTMMDKVGGHLQRPLYSGEVCSAYYTGES